MGIETRAAFLATVAPATTVQEAAREDHPIVDVEVAVVAILEEVELVEEDVVVVATASTVHSTTCQTDTLVAAATGITTMPADDPETWEGMTAPKTRVCTR